MTLLAGLMIVIGLVGIVLPVLPGLLLVWGGVTVWALARADPLGWTVLAAATALALAGTLVKYWLPGRRMRAQGVGRGSLAAGAVLGLVGLFVIPVLGLVIGFVLGVYLAERHRLGDHSAAVRATGSAVRAVGVSLGIEVVTALLIATAWLIGLLLG